MLFSFFLLCFTVVILPMQWRHRVLQTSSTNRLTYNNHNLTWQHVNGINRFYSSCIIYSMKKKRNGIPNQFLWEDNCTVPMHKYTYATCWHHEHTRNFHDLCASNDYQICMDMTVAIEWIYFHILIFFVWSK